MVTFQLSTVFCTSLALYMMTRIWKERSLYQKFQQTSSDGILLCDSSYRQLPWLMSSFAITTVTPSKGTKMTSHGAQLSTSMVYRSLYVLPKLFVLSKPTTSSMPALCFKTLHIQGECH